MTQQKSATLGIQELTLKAVVIQAFGGPEGLAVVDLPDPIPAEGQVLIAIKAIGVGFQDAMIRSGAFAAMGFKEGHILGGEIAGTVSAVGSGIDPTWIGRRVWAFTGLGGGYAELAVAPASGLIPIPDGMSFAQAVAIGSSGMVAHFALAHAQFKTGETVLVRGAAGPIGIMAVQLAVRGGASVVAVTTSSPARGDRLRALGASHVLDRAGNGPNSAPSGYDVIIDIVAGTDLAAFFAKLNPNGRMVTVGAVGGFPPEDFAKAMFPAFQKSLSFSTFSANTVTDSERRKTTAELFASANHGELEIVIQEVWQLDQAVLAHQKMETSEAFGRLLLKP